MVFLDLIEKKKQGVALTDDEIDVLVSAYVDDEVADYQMAAFLMAVRWRGLSAAETTRLTAAMAGSGTRFDFSDIPGPKIDKHSTGGVGDKVSLVLAPLAAACGCIVPMVSGRGLGHTGGTLDKLESIPGFRTDLSYDEFHRQLATIGFAMGAQTLDLVPADRRLYELRSLTGTVDEIGLITASILSKKIAEGAEGLVLDVKTGSGAFMPRLDDARRLADSLQCVAELAGVRCRALITGMDQPLGAAVGNALEVVESIDVLARRENAPADLEELTIELVAEMLVMGEITDDLDGGRAAAGAALDDGSALAKLGELIAAQGGDAAVIDDTGALPRAAETTTLAAPDDGWVVGLDARLIGEAAGAVGAGRARREDPLDPGAGLLLHCKRGHRLGRDEPWVTLYHGAGADVRRACAKLAQALTLAAEEPPPAPLVIERRP